MNKLGMLVNKNFLTLLLTTESADLSKDLSTSQELFIFLAKYSFLLPDTPPENDFSKRQLPPPGDMSTQNSNGARYLDPKYSRWLSTDPALGEYVPAAGKGNANDAGNLPGMGGIYNSVNGNLYHYAGNNPVKYVDPDGREEYDSTITYEQWEMIPGCTFESFLDSEKKLAGKTWQETQEFFNQYPNGRIYRNPDEGFYSYNYYTNEGKDKPHYYNMYTADELFIWGIGSGLFKIGKGLITKAGEKAIGKISIHGAERIAKEGATRGGVLTAKEIIKTRKIAQQVFRATKNDTIVHVLKNQNGTFNMVVDGTNGLITSFKNISEKSFTRLAENYGFVLLE